MLARYMLTAVPLVIVLAVSTLRRRLPYWTTATALVGGIFVLAWIWNPPYGFSPEDNLAYRDYIVLHQRGEKFVEARYPMAQCSDSLAGLGRIVEAVAGVRDAPGEGRANRGFFARRDDRQRLISVLTSTWR